MKQAAFFSWGKHIWVCLCVQKSLYSIIFSKSKLVYFKNVIIKLLDFRFFFKFKSLFSFWGREIQIVIYYIAVLFRTMFLRNLRIETAIAPASIQIAAHQIEQVNCEPVARVVDLILVKSRVWWNLFLSFKLYFFSKKWGFRILVKIKIRKCVLLMYAKFVFSTNHFRSICGFR